ncbi:MAG TPA: hypothetical protein VI755_00735 [Anaerolineales bacterium]|nr:hypothetical protein [Anaerolineales bacterium]
MGQQPGVAPGGQQHVGVVALQDGAQPDQQGTGGFQRQAVGVTRAVNGQVGRRGMRRVMVWLYAQDAQGWGQGVQLPGTVQGDNLFHLAGFVCQDAATRQGEEIVGGGVVQGQRQIGVVIGQVGEGTRHLPEEARLGEGLVHLNGEHGERLLGEQVAAFGARQPHWHGLGLEEAPQGAQARGRPGGVKCHREGLVQALAKAVLAQQPQHHAAVGIGEQVEQPAGDLHPQIFLF